MKTLHFKSKKNYLKWVAFGHIHHVFKGKGTGVNVKIHGHYHKIKHKK